MLEIFAQKKCQQHLDFGILFSFPSFNFETECFQFLTEMYNWVQVEALALTKAQLLPVTFFGDHLNIITSQSSS